ncbi:hypothetical protein PHLCEN_2v2361 [Hermanssonia centrifuga]|uniref:Uncharacterized protein n=1 Tax=Hermanssonia centrifuga TaxID=98765 RepID=A0A2R6RMA7_9APHY|nr:hypothetical protein PHLCEN_2v2361 [Hermanssonia centrifuga]
MTNFKLPKIKKPFTPIMRRFLHDVFNPSDALGKRGRDEDEENVPPGLTPEAGQPNCVALQNEDADADAIVITALNAVPFCCHADLITMSHAQLITVATTLNVKLPLALKIDTSPSHSTAFIRNSIELLVGIRRDVPQAPKPNRSLSILAPTSDADISRRTLLPPSPISPLASRHRSNTSLLGTVASPRLASLLEHDEERPWTERPHKKRRIQESSPSGISTLIQRDIVRSQSHRVARSSASHSARVGRSQSQRIPDGRFIGAHRNITTTRGRSRYRPQSVVMTSTPKARKPMTTLTERNVSDDLDISPPSTVSASSTLSFSSSSEKSTPRVQRVRGWLGRRSSAGSGDARMLVSGIQDISMATATSSSGSGMDMSLG